MRVKRGGRKLGGKEEPVSKKMGFKATLLEEKGGPKREKR